MYPTCMMCYCSIILIGKKTIGLPYQVESLSRITHPWSLLKISREIVQGEERYS